MSIAEALVIYLLYFFAGWGVLSFLGLLALAALTFSARRSLDAELD